MGIQFNGTNTRVDFENESFFDWDWGQAFSVACWVNVEPGLIGGGAFVVGKAGPPGWALDINLPATDDTTFSLHLIDSPGVEIWKYGPTQAWPRGVWAHICSTYDGSSTLAGVNLYLNGLLVGGGGGTDVDAAGGSLLGNNPLSVAGTGSGGEWTDVAVANAILEKRVWTRTEIANLANIANFSRNATELLNEPPDWHARLSSTTDLLDYSGNSNDGSLVGSPSNLADPKVVYRGQRGTGQISGTSDTVTFTTTADIMAGDHVVFATSYYNQHGNLLWVRFGDGELTLAQDKKQVLGGLPVHCEIWSKRATVRIPSGTTVTAKFEISTDNAIIAHLDVLSGVMVGGHLDQTAGTFSESSVSTFDSGTTGSTGLADEVAFSAFAFGTSTTSPLVTPESGWVETFEANDTTGFANLHLETAIRVLTATGTQRHQPTSDVAQAYAGAIATYRVGQVEPTPPLLYSRHPKKVMVSAP
jgi:hypothetical protein